MNASIVDPLIQDTLYRGHILYPYRAAFRDYTKSTSGLGGVYPIQAGGRASEPNMMQTECLLLKRGERASFEVEVRFLHPQRRDVGLLDGSSYKADAGDDPKFRLVPELAVAGKIYESWQEAVERRVKAGPIRLFSERRSSISCRFSYSASRSMEPIRDGDRVVGILIRRQEALEGKVEVEARPLAANCFKISVRISNLSRWAQAWMDRESVFMRTMMATHTLLYTGEGEFVSLWNPPDNLRTLVEDCSNIGAWPVLVGEKAKAERNMMLSATLIFPDYPENRRVNRAAPRAQAKPTPTPAATVDEPPSSRIPARGLRSSSRSSSQVAGASNRGIPFKIGDHVKLRPRNRADALELMLSGKKGVIEALEQDKEGQMQAVVAIENDLDRRLGFDLPSPRHRFVYRLDELELLGERDLHPQFG